MARKVDPEIPQIIDARFQETPQEQIDLENDADSEERAFLDEFQINDSVHNYHARIYRVVNGVQSFVEQVGPDKFPIEERLQNLHKGGHFRAILFKNGIIWKNKTYRVEPPSTPAPVAPPSQIGEIADLIARQNEQLTNIMQRGGPSAAPQDPVAMMTAMMAAMVQMKEFLTPAQSQGGSSIKDFMEMLAFAKEIVSDGGGGGRSAFDLAAEFLRSPIAGELAEQFRSQRTTPQTPGISPPRALEIPALKGPMTATAMGQSPGILPPPMPEILGSFDQATLAQMKGQVDFWVTRAARGSDPGLYAELLLDTLPVEFAASFINHPQLMEAITHLNPAAAPYLQWFVGLKDAVNHILTDDGEEAEKSGEAAESLDVSRSSAPAVNPHGNTVGPGRGGSDIGDHVATGQRGKNKPGDPPKSGKPDKRAGAKELDGGNRGAP